MEQRTFKSRVDAWLLAILLISVITSFSVTAVIASAASASLLIAVPIVLLGGVFPLWLLLQTDYALVGAILIIRSGPFRWKIPVADIRSIVPTRNPLSSPALSLDRLQIDYGPGRTILVSPRDKDGFMEALQAGPSNPS